MTQPPTPLTPLPVPPVSPTSAAPARKASSGADEITTALSCIDCVNALFHCWGAWHQFDRLYKDGAFDSCDRPQAELLLCLRLKLTARREERLATARELLREPHSPTCGEIWSLKSSKVAAVHAP